MTNIWRGESFYNPLLAPLVEEMEEAGISEDSDGAKARPCQAIFACTQAWCSLKMNVVALHQLDYPGLTGGLDRICALAVLTSSKCLSAGGSRTALPWPVQGARAQRSARGC